MSKPKVEGILNWPAPKTPKQVRQFLGLCNFYWHFIPDFSTIAHPLHQMTRKNIQWAWTEEQQQAFEALKVQFTREPTLKVPEMDKPFIVETDASLVGTGAILY